MPFAGYGSVFSAAQSPAQVWPVWPLREASLPLEALVNNITYSLLFQRSNYVPKFIWHIPVS